MECKIIENEKNKLVIESDDKTLLSVLSSELKSMGVDAYSYDPHPLIKGYRLSIEASNPSAVLKKAMKKAGADWKKLGDLVEDKAPKK
ncbi:MAG: hypothetical protein V1921_09150 [Candidatus Altiarchaeota archaeon]